MSLTGTSHIKKGTVCQDSHKAAKLSNGWVVAAVADGVGSAKHSEIASALAVQTVVEVCTEKITSETKLEDVKPILLEAYTKAEERIEIYADEHGDPITDYDTTLSSVVYDGAKLVYGHSGDGGIIGLATDGKYVRITRPQKAEDNVCVIPLRAGAAAWEIKDAEGPFASVLLATDGIYDTFFPYLLKGQETEVYVPLVRYFLDNTIMGGSEKNIQELQDNRIAFVNSPTYASVEDDKTVLVVINEKVKPGVQEDAYYAEPDWARLEELWRRRAYPHLYEAKIIRCKGRKQEAYVLEKKPLATGERGALHAVEDSKEFVALLFNEENRPAALEEKLTSMSAKVVSKSLLDVANFPQDVIYDNDGNFMGVLLNRKIHDRSLRDICEVGNETYKNLTWSYKISVAENLCAAFDVIHKAGYLVGETSAKTIYADRESGRVFFTDVDCLLAEGEEAAWNTDRPENIPPEVQKALAACAANGGEAAAQPKHSVVTDRFALALHIFKLLMNGSHPFACRLVNPDEDADCPQPGKNIADGYFPFAVQKEGMSIPVYAPAMDILDKDVQALFTKAFVEGYTTPDARPDATAWATALGKMKKKTKKCKANADHIYYKKVGKCPWCALDGNAKKQ